MSSARRGAVTRRRLLVMGGAGGLGALAAPELAGGEARHGSAEAEREEWLSGVVDRVGGDALYITTRTGETRVELEDGAVVLRDGKATLDDFRPGEEVSAAGEHARDGTFRAQRVEAVYRIMATTVESEDGNQIETTDGTVVSITSETEARGGGALGHDLAAKEPEELDPGDRIVVAGRKVPRSRRIRANRVGLIVE